MPRRKGFNDASGLFPAFEPSAISLPEIPPDDPAPDDPSSDDLPTPRAEPAAAVHAAAAVAPAGAEGHRARLRNRLLTAGPDALADHEVIEMTLFLALPRRDTKPIARALLARFGSFAAAIAAPVVELRRIDGLGEAGVAALKVVHAAAMRLARADVVDRPVLGNWHRTLDYLHTVLARERVEQFRILFLDSRNHLIADEVQAVGTVNHTPVYPREVLKRALDLHATAIILVHNHPSGDATPSPVDVDMTRSVCRAAEPLGIAVHDHLIVGNGKVTSLRRQKLM